MDESIGTTSARTGEAGSGPKGFAVRSQDRPMTKPLRVLLVEDSEDAAQLVTRTLLEFGFEVRSRRVSTARQMCQALDEADWDVVLGDTSLAGFDGLSALGLLKSTGRDIPFLLVCDAENERTAVEAMRCGAQDYVLKDNLTRLGPALARELRARDERKIRRRAEETLREHEERFRAFMDNSPAIAFLKDDQGRYVYANRPLQELLKKPIETILGHTDAEVWPPEAAQALVLRDAQVLCDNEPCEWIESLTGPDGVARDWLVVTFPFTDRRARKHLGGVAIDISARLRAEKEIQRQVDRQAALLAIDKAINCSLDVHVILSVLLDQTTAQLRVDAASVLLLNAADQTLEYAAGRGFRTAGIRHSRLRVDDGLAGRAIRERRVVGVNGPEGAADAFSRRHLFANEGFRTVYCAPLLAKNRVRGVLEIYHRSSLQPAAEWLEFFEALADLAAIAVDNAEMFEELQRTNEDVLAAYDATLEGWSRVLDLRDEETDGHTRRVTDLTLRLARSMGIPEAQLVHIRRGSLLHDIGKIGIPDRILKKPGPLDPDEWQIMKMHPVYAFEMLAPIEFLRPALDLPYCHHEKWDGTGYPRGLKGEQIPLAARIFAVADVYDAMVSDRSYRDPKSFPKDEVRQRILEKSGTHFDPRVVEVFLNLELD